MILILFGVPGTGKGTIAQKLQNEGVGKQVSTGDLYRREMELNSEIGKRAREVIEAGKLVNDKDTLELLSREVERDIILDGYPRTIKQVNDLDALLKEKNLKIDLVVNLTANKEVVVDRIINRRVCSKCKTIYNTKYAPTKKDGICDKCGGEVIHRKDDKRELIETRFDEYKNKTEPVLDAYKKRGIVIEIDSTKPNLIEAIKQHLK